MFAEQGFVKRSPEFIHEYLGLLERGEMTARSDSFQMLRAVRRMRAQLQRAGISISGAAKINPPRGRFPTATTPSVRQPRNRWGGCRGVACDGLSLLRGSVRQGAS